MIRPHVHVDATPAVAAGPQILARIEDCLAERGRCRIALSGGSTPGPLLRWLGEHVPAAYYPALAITWADERILPTLDGGPHLGDDGWPRWGAWHPDTNLKLAWTRWLEAAEALPGDVLGMHGLDPVDAEAQFTPAFLERFDGAIDVALLGVGPDGHVASLFPEHEALGVEGCAVAVPDSPKPPPGRLSLTLGVLAEASHVFVIATGAEKAAPLRRALQGEGPLGRLLTEAVGEVAWWLDEGAASAIGQGEISDTRTEEEQG